MSRRQRAYAEAHQLKRAESWQWDTSVPFEALSEEPEDESEGSTDEPDLVDA